MKKLIFYCDKCGKEGASEIWVYLDRMMDAAGSMEDEWDSVDLCQKCMAIELQIFLDGKDNVVGHIKRGRAFVDKVKKVKRP